MLIFFWNIFNFFRIYFVVGCIVYGLFYLFLFLFIRGIAADSGEFGFASFVDFDGETERASLLSILAILYAAVLFYRFSFLTRAHNDLYSLEGLSFSSNISPKKVGYLIYKTVQVFPRIFVLFGVFWVAYAVNCMLYVLFFSLFAFCVLLVFSISVPGSIDNWFGIFFWGKYILQKPSLVFYRLLQGALIEAGVVVLVIVAYFYQNASLVNLLIIFTLCRFQSSIYSAVGNLVVLYYWLACRNSLEEEILE